MSDARAGAPGAADGEGRDADGSVVPERKPERRWPMAAAVITCLLLHASLPQGLRPPNGWIGVVLVVLMLIMLIAGDPGRIDRRKRWLSVVNWLLIGAITLGNIFSAVQLVDGILHNAAFTKPEELLLAGGAVWLTNVIAFALWYWDLDGGGTAARYHGVDSTPAFIFPEMQHRDVVGEAWYPRFHDYLSFSFATAMAFSPTDVSAVRPWAKLLCTVESVVSLTLAALVIARAVNIL